MLIFIGIEDGIAEQLACIVLVFLAVVFWQQLLTGFLLLVETLDGLQYEGVNDVLVVVPVKTLFFKQGVKVVIILNERTINLTPHLAVSSVIVLLVSHIIVVNLTFRNLKIQLFKKFGIVVPRFLLCFHQLVEHLVLFKLQCKTVVSELL